MPKKRRQAHIPQQQSSRRRRTIRRPDVAPTPQPAERTDAGGQPIFADDAALSAATAPYGTTGPVETRPHWIGNTAQQQRMPGRRTAQLRRAGAVEATARVTAGQLPTFERAFLADELKRIAVISVLLFAFVIVLALVMR